MDNLIVLHTTIFILTGICSGIATQFWLNGNLPGVSGLLDIFFPTVMVGCLILVFNGCLGIIKVDKTTVAVGFGAITGALSTFLASIIKKLRKKDPLALVKVVSSTIGTEAAEKTTELIDKISSMPDEDTDSG